MAATVVQNSDRLEVGEKDVNQDGPGDVMPGFRFHPTDEELLDYYLRRKVANKHIAVEVITQLDIYKFEPWDLPKMAVAKGEKAWYFFCPRECKYRNSARPNRVTRAGFWKATGTDRPIYSADGRRCIGLKKSLVFYKGRAAKCLKTEWMMHEFRLTSNGDAPKVTTTEEGGTTLGQDGWAVCRILRKSTLSQKNRPTAVDDWSMPEIESEIITSDPPHRPREHQRQIDTQSAVKEMCSSAAETVTVDYDTGEEISESSYEVGSLQSNLPIMQKGYQSMVNVGKQAQMKRDQLLSAEMHWSGNNFGAGFVDPSRSQHNGMVVDPRSNGGYGQLQSSANNNGLISLERLNGFFSADSPTGRSGLNFVDYILNSPRTAGLLAYNSGSFNERTREMEQTLQALVSGQDFPNSKPHDSSINPLMSNYGDNHKYMCASMQPPQMHGNMQHWDLTSQVFDVSTPSPSQLECM